MKQRSGLFVVFEGIDGCGKGVQARMLLEYIQGVSKYQDILITHEPWRSTEIKRRLEEDRNAFVDGERMAQLFVDDRIRHTTELVQPMLERGVIIVCDRYAMSTCAYQYTQGVNLDSLLTMHRKKDIILPDITYVLEVSRKIAETRRRIRGDPQEKYEREATFIERLMQNYKLLGEMVKKDQTIFGKVIVVNGNGNPEEVAQQIVLRLMLFTKDGE